MSVMIGSTQKSPTDPSNLGDSNRHGKIITFYSYKGGTGRSMSLANVAWILASAGKHVLAVDWDLEAPGLHRYFSPFLRDKKLSATEGVINFADEYRQRAMTPADPNTLTDWYLDYADLSHYAARLDWDFGNGGYLDFVPAGQQDAEYSGLVNSFNWETFFVNLGGNRLLDATKERLRVDYDYILIDSRTGVSDTSGICTVKMPDILVVCFTLNNQSIDGAASVAYDVFSKRADEVRIFPVPMRLDNGELKKLQARSEYAQKQFFQFPNNAGTVSKSQYWADIPVSYVTYYAYDEVLAAFGEKDPKVASMLASSERLTSYLTDGAVAKLSPPSESLRLKKLAEFEGRELETTPAEKLSQIAQSNFNRLSIEEQKKASRVLLRLVRVPRAEEKAEPSRQRAVVDDLGDRSLLVRKLIDGGILQFAGKDENGNLIVELVNDELLLGWPELRKWIEADRDFLLWRQQLHVDAVNSSRQTPSEKWLAARATSEAKQWLKTRPDDLTADETTFLRSSISTAHRRWFKIAAVMVLTLMIIVIGNSLIRKKLTASVDQSDAQTLATEAQKLIDSSVVEPAVKYDQLQLGALLALESHTLAPSDATKALLDRALSRLVIARLITSLASDSSVVRIAWSSDGKAITTVTGRARDVDPNGGLSRTREDRKVAIRDIVSGKNFADPIAFKDGVQKFSISTDGRYVAFSRTDPTLNRMRQTSRPSYVIELLDLKTGEQIPVDTRQAQIFSMVFSPDSKTMITTGDEDTAVLIDVENHKVLKKIRHQGVVTAASFSPDSQYVATVSDDLYARVWRVSDPEGSRTAKLPIKINSVATKVLFTPDQRHLITLPYLSGRPYAEMWELQDQDQPPVDQQSVRFDHSGVVRDVSISPDGKYVATLAENGEIRVWDALNATANSNGINAIQTINMAGNISRIIFSTDSNYLVGMGDRPIVSVWRLPDFGYTTLVSNNGSVNDMAFNAAFRALSLIGIATESVQVWDFRPGISSQPCDHITRSLSLEEWSRYLPNRPYRQICSDVSPTSPQ